MSILISQGELTTTSYTYTLTTGTTSYTDPHSGTYYKATKVVDYGEEVRYLKFTSGTAGYEISGKTVTYTITENTSSKSRTFTVEVTCGKKPINVTDVKTTSGTPVNYVKTYKTSDNTSKYVWCRPATLSVQLPWNYYSSWAISRETGSLSPSSSVGTVISSSTFSTSGVNTYSMSGFYYGDKIKLTYTARPGATGLGLASGSTYTVDPTFAISDTTASSTGFPAPGISVTDDLNFEKGDWDSIKKKSDTDAFTVRVTNNSPCQCDVYFRNANTSGVAHAYYRADLNWTTHTDDDCDIRLPGGTVLETMSYSYGGTISGNTSKDFTLYIVPSTSVTKAWPKYAEVGVKLEPTSTHAYNPSYNTNSSYGGTKPSSGSGSGTGSGSGGLDTRVNG